MNLALTIATLLIASPAMAGESIVIQPLPYTMKCMRQYGSIEACIIGLVEVSRKLTIERDALKVLPPKPVAEKIEPAPKPKAKPVMKVKAKPRSCPVLKGNQKCKPGRTQSPKHNCKCGVWK